MRCASGSSTRARTSISILLARELDAALVSSDRGVVRWAERLGVRIIHPEQLRGALEELATPPDQSIT